MTQSKQESQEIGSEYKSMLDPSTCTRRGLCPVTEIRHQAKPLESHSLYYEVHGSGPIKVVLIMGLNGTSGDWLLQVRHFGRLPQYSVLVFDNRGVGNSSSPRGPYTTSGMANDTIVLLDFLGWTADRELHVIGISMGGMIAQELASRIPKRISSLSLVVTKAGGQPWHNLPRLKTALLLARALSLSDVEDRIPVVQSMLFPSEWLAQKAEGDPQGRTNAEVQASIYRSKFGLIRPQPLLGALSQLAAVFTHHVSPDRLRKISASIPKVLILTGDTDVMVDPSESLFLKNNMPEAEYQCWKGSGHAICVQWDKRANALFERVIEEGRAASEKAS
ncbi:Alpha/Beta hydrolase protein [Pisolithus thermaeus]|nr:Alpha/Beta hydrolase protein [Pisolithus croceorrhizus]KAI6164305.1 Alpha/Beta hydrolase protein [Pisolithus thermaeus]